MRLKGRTALISGAGKNVGKAIALAFAREGASLALVDKTPTEELRGFIDERKREGTDTLLLEADISDHQQVNRMAQHGEDHFGRIDVIVSVAGIRPHRPIWEYSYDEWHQAFAVNLHSTFYLAKALTPGMMKRRMGSIIALGGRASQTSQPNVGAIVASKHGLHGLIKSLALDLGPYGVRANMLVLSNIGGRPETDPDSGITKKIPTPLGRSGTPEEVASAALFLASDDSSYSTGDRICCAGGRYM